jgi:hypothetical protein
MKFTIKITLLLSLAISFNASHSMRPALRSLQRPLASLLQPIFLVNSRALNIKSIKPHSFAHSTISSFAPQLAKPTLYQGARAFSSKTPQSSSSSSIPHRRVQFYGRLKKDYYVMVSIDMNSNKQTPTWQVLTGSQDNLMIDPIIQKKTIALGRHDGTQNSSHVIIDTLSGKKLELIFTSQGKVDCKFSDTKNKKEYFASELLSFF